MSSVFDITKGLYRPRRPYDEDPNPSPIAAHDCVLWLSPETNYVFTSGGAVTGWFDRSTYCCNASPGQSSGTSQPGYTSGTSVDFDGSNDCLVMQSGVHGSAGGVQSTFGSGPITVGLDFQLSATPGSGVIYSAITLGQMAPDFTIDFFEILFCNSSGYKAVTFIGHNRGVVTALGFTTTLDTSRHQLIVTYNGGTNTTAGNYTATLDGVSQTVAASSGVGRVASYSSIGARETDTGTVSLPFKGSLRKTVAYSRVINAGEASNFQTYLAS